MVIIHNISRKYSKTDWQTYEVKINLSLICTFRHKASDGLAKCLELASKAVEEKEKENNITKGSIKDIRQQMLISKL